MDLLAAAVSTAGGPFRAENLSKTFILKDENALPRRSGIGGCGGTSELVLVICLARLEEMVPALRG